MLIISKFHDFYDSVARKGIDKTIVYTRTTEQIDSSNLYKQIINNSFYKIGTTISKRLHQTDLISEFFPIFIIFCGKIKVLFGEYYSYGFAIRSNKNRIRLILPHEMKLIAENQDEISKLKHKKWTQTYEQAMSYNNKIYDMTELKCPIVIAESYITIKNPCLKDFNFEKIVDPYTAFQEIQMYISGVLATGDKNLQLPIPDKLKAKSKGFNDLSFRRQEHTRKSKRTTNKV